jgi:hypothetical protein
LQLFHEKAADDAAFQYLSFKLLAQSL